VALRKLRQIHRVSRVEDLFEAPANHLEAPKSGREGQWSLSLDGSWRMCFEWRNGDAYEVQIVDCH
jgi:proteic killer suppression protein